MRTPAIFIKYKMPLERIDFLDRYWRRRDENLTERWAMRGIVRLLRDIRSSIYTHVEEDPLGVLFA